MKHTSLAKTAISHYHLLARIGAGGMGEVYRAEDTVLGRPVVLKLLAPHLLANYEARTRFLREAKLASLLDHPHICTIHEIAEADGQYFIVMQFVEGQTLRQAIDKRPLALDSLFSIGMQIADALAAAHVQGIMHRDVKSDNIMITPHGQVKVLDFGLAKLIERQESAIAIDITCDHEPVGTAASMSPEQARGERLDHRSDIFSFGVVLYEMATGRPPFKEKSRAETMNAVINNPHTPVRELNDEIPPALADVIDRMLAKNPGDRYQTMPEVIEDLRQVAQSTSAAPSDFPGGLVIPYVQPAKQTWYGSLRRSIDKAPGSTGVAQRLKFSSFILIALVAIGAIALSVRLAAYFNQQSDEKAIETLAVLPFINESANPEMEYLSDGITDSIIYRLSQLPHLRVKSRNSVFRYKGKDTDPQAVGADLGVQTAVVGRITQRGDDLIINAELISIADNSLLWGQKYSCKLTEVLAVQEEITKQISAKLRLRLTGAERDLLAKHYTENTEAYQAYLKGRYWWNKRTEQGFQKAIEFFNQAIEKDPSFALAYSGLADCYALLSDYGLLAPKEGYPKAKEEALKALQADDNLAEAHTSLAFILFIYDWNFSAAEKEYKRAIELNPNYSVARLWYSTYLSGMGRHDEALAILRQAQEADPFSLIVNRNVGRAYYFSRQYDQAIEQLNKTLEMDRNFIRTYTYLGSALEQKGMTDQAIAIFQEGLRIYPDERILLSRLGHAYAVTGKRAEAQKILRRLNEIAQQCYVSPYEFALIYAGLNEKDKAFEWLEKAFYEPADKLVDLKVEPQMDNLRSDPRFANLIRRVGLP